MSRAKHHAIITTPAELAASLRAGPHAWPGGYPLFFVTGDGAVLSFDAVRENYRACVESIRGHHNDGWRVVGLAVNWEHTDLLCDHTGNLIESAY